MISRAPGSPSGHRAHAGDVVMRQSPPGKLQFAATRVIRSVPEAVLGDVGKLVLLEMYGLQNGPKGCFMRAEGLAQRLGYRVDWVEEVRRALKLRGLLEKISHPADRRTASYYVVLPSDCLPGTHPTDAEVLDCAHRLADHLRERCGEWRTRRPDINPDTPAHRRRPWDRVPTETASVDQATTRHAKSADVASGYSPARSADGRSPIGGRNGEIAGRGARLVGTPTSHPHLVEVGNSEVGAPQEAEAEVGQRRALPLEHDQASGAALRRPASLAEAVARSGFDLIRDELIRNGAGPKEDL